MVEHGAARIPVGISTCLLGEHVRFDGGHKRDAYITETLGRAFTWVPVCPEVEVGMGTPRESVRLVGDVSAPSMLGHKTRTDHTEAMNAFSHARVDALEKEALRGYILKKDSPSCGPDRVKVLGEKGQSTKNGRGLFAAVLQDRMPMLPIIDEGRLHDPPLRENFVERVFAYDRWLRFRARAPKAKDFVAFHTANKMAMLAHDRPAYTELGRLVARAGEPGLEERLDAYGLRMMEALTKRATRRKHADVLYHLLGFLKQSIDRDDKTELVDCIERYRNGVVPLVVPLTLLNHHFRRNPVDWVLEQTYLDPYPAELTLRGDL